MAKTKKRKTKKSKKKTKTKTARRIRPKTVKKKKETTKKKQKQSTRQAIRQAAYTLCMSGSIIVLAAAILALIFPAMLSSFGFSETLTLFRMILFTSISLVSGIILLIATKKANRHPGVSGIIILVFSIVTLMLPPYGFIFGPLLSLIGSILLLIRR